MVNGYIPSSTINYIYFRPIGITLHFIAICSKKSTEKITKQYIGKHTNPAPRPSSSPKTRARMKHGFPCLKKLMQSATETIRHLKVDSVAKLLKTLLVVSPPKSSPLIFLISMASGRMRSLRWTKSFYSVALQAWWNPAMVIEMELRKHMHMCFWHHAPWRRAKKLAHDWFFSGKSICFL